MLRLLIAKDSKHDVELEVHELKRAGLAVTYRIADRRESFTEALRDFAPDVIISDFSMPAFDGMEALRLTSELAPHVPLIFVSGTLGEEYAIRALKDGATDYVLKTNLVRLPAAVERAVADARVRRERLRAETELQIARERLQEREAGLARAQHMAKLAHVITAPNGSFKTWSDTFPELVGADRAHMPRSIRGWLKLLHPDDDQKFRSASTAAGSTGRRTDVDYRVQRRNGEWIHVQHVMEPLESQPGTKGERRWFNTLQDVTEQTQASERISRLNRVYAVLSGINSTIVRVRDRDELFHEACRIAVELGGLRLAYIGLVDHERQRIRPVAWAGDHVDFAQLERPLQRPGAPRGGASQAIHSKRPVVQNDIRADPQQMTYPDQALARGYRSVAALPLVVGERAIGVLSLFAGEPGYFDVEEMRLLEDLASNISFAVDHIEKAERLNHLAYYDSVTGLANRALFHERLAEHVRTSEAYREQFAVCIFDVDRFKTINDTFGRRTGDMLLKQIAGRMTQATGDPGRLARVNADAFALVIPGIQNVDDAARRLEQALKACLSSPFAIDDRELRVAGKAGLALFPTDGDDDETLFAHAEAALKRTKQTGDRYLFYAEQMTTAVAENLKLENKLRQALENEEFVLHYQPKVDLQSMRIVGLEALIRWQSPELGLVPPMQFIPLMEQTGLILEVGVWALRRAVLDHRRWTDEQLSPPPVAVNVSAIQLRQQSIVDTVAEAVDQGAKPTAVELEITESLLMDDIEGNIEKLRAIRHLGVKMAIDDFGTGHSSLAYLARLPVDALKIDRSFIIRMLDSPDAMTLVRTIISLAHSLKLTVVAEGVDSEEQAKTLRLLGCDHMQGYLYSKPLEAGKLVSLLRGARLGR
ncbi:MAG: EAL domain-containing protein [Betaproteobacteria bacterium]